jgi:hypothetical protein
MRLLRDPRADRWLRRYAIGVLVSLALMAIVTVVGRDGHRTGALVVLACIHIAAQGYGVRCLWQATRALLGPAPARLNR